MNNKLLFDKETMQKLGYRVVDMIVNHITELPEKSATKQKTRPEFITYTYMLSLQAYYDSSGKIVTIGVTANFIGEGLGPLLTGSLLLFYPLTITAWVAIVLIILSTLFIFPLVSEYDQSQK